MSTRGGAREGSGRKKKDTKLLSLRVPKDLITGLSEKFPDVRERNSEIIKALKLLLK